MRAHWNLLKVSVELLRVTLNNNYNNIKCFFHISDQNIIYIMKREREFDTSGNIRKKNKFRRPGIFAHNIPKKIEFNTISTVSKSNSFIPAYNESHIRMAYYQFNDLEAKIKIEEKLLMISPKIKLINFKTKGMNINSVILKLQAISTKMNELLTYLNSNYRNSNDIDIDCTLQIIKAIALKILAKNSKHFEKSFLFLNSSMEVAENATIKCNSRLKWIIIFYWCWFVSFKIKRDSYYFRFFSDFKPDSIEKIIELFNKATNVIKYLSADIFCKYFFLENAVDDEDSRIMGIKSILEYSQPFKLKNLYKHADRFKKILSSAIIQKCSGLDIKELTVLVNEFIANAYLVDLPGSIHSVTLCSKLVAIERLPEDYQKTTIVIGVTIMRMLRELGNFLQKYKLPSYYAWFEKITLAENRENDPGVQFIKKIFNYEPEFITIEATNFLLKLKNWARPHEEFITHFKAKNIFSDDRDYSYSPDLRGLTRYLHEPGARNRWCRWARRNPRS